MAKILLLANFKASRESAATLAFLRGVNDKPWNTSDVTVRRIFEGLKSV